jgi:hypothetical protein
MLEYRAGDFVWWWKRITPAIEYPYRAEVVRQGAARVTIRVFDCDSAAGHVLRHVAVERVHPVGEYFEKSLAQRPALSEPVASWGGFTRYLHVGDDLRALRHVDLFEDGQVLSYDRRHWVDEYGMLADAQINRNRKAGPWGRSEEIEAAEFEQVWALARSSPNWTRQAGLAQMAQLGAVPIWLKVDGWRPALKKRGRSS